MSSAHDGKQDKVVLEGWWRKTGKKGYVDIKGGSNRYFVLTERYLDWYKKPGEPRAGTLGLDALYIRLHADGCSLILGNLVTGGYQKGKEFQLSTESGDARARAKEWYDKITATIDDYKELKRGGLRKKTEVEGKKNELPDVAVPEKKEVVVEKKVDDVPPVAAPIPVSHSVTSEQKVVQNGNTTVTTTTEINPFSFGGTTQTPPTPQVQVHHHSPQVQHTVYGAPAPAPTMTVNYNPAPTMTVNYAPQPMFTQPVMAPVVTPVMASPTFVTSSPYGVGFVQPSVSVPKQCMFCRQVFQPPPTPVFACPFCNQINQAGPQMTTVTYAAPTFY